MNAGSLFSGIGLLDLGLHLAGVEHRWLCESDSWRRSILARRFPDARLYDDVRHIGIHNAEPVELIAGGFPCKGASTVGPQNGFDHPETALWREMRRAIGELEPRYVLIENVANLLALHHGAVWGEVLSDLAALGFDVVWDCVPAAAVGAPHLRDRVFAVATYAADVGPERGGPARNGRGGPAYGRLGDATPADTARDAEGRTGATAWPEWERARTRAVDWGEYEPAIRRWERVHGPAPAPLVERVRRVDDRSAAKVERSRLSALGDGVQVQVGRIVGEYILGLERERVT